MSESFKVGGLVDCLIYVLIMIGIFVVGLYLKIVKVYLNLCRYCETIWISLYSEISFINETLSLQNGSIDPICNFLFLKTPPPVKIFNLFSEFINFYNLYP